MQITYQHYANYANTPNFWYQRKSYEQPGLHNTIISLHVRMFLKDQVERQGFHHNTIVMV